MSCGIRKHPQLAFNFWPFNLQVPEVVTVSTALTTLFLDFSKASGAWFTARNTTLQKEVGIFLQRKA
jgi:hypothetical protein